MNEPRHRRISQVAYDWVASDMNEPCHIWMSHVTCEGVMSNTVLRASSFRPLRASMWHDTHLSHVAYKWVTSHIKSFKRSLRPRRAFMSHGTYISHVTDKRVTSRMNTSCPIWMSHVTSHHVYIIAFWSRSLRPTRASKQLRCWRRRVLLATWPCSSTSIRYACINVEMCACVYIHIQIYIHMCI